MKIMCVWKLILLIQMAEDMKCNVKSVLMAWRKKPTTIIIEKLNNNKYNNILLMTANNGENVVMTAIIHNIMILNIMSKCVCEKLNVNINVWLM